MKKHFPFLLAFVIIISAVSGCAGNIAAFNVRPYTAATKEVPTYVETIPIKDIALTDENVDSIESMMYRLYEISQLRITPIVMQCSGEFELSEDWYLGLINHHDTFAEKCNTYLKSEAPSDLVDLKTLSDIAVIRLFNAVEQTRAAASSGKFERFKEARALITEALAGFSVPGEYIQSLYDRDPFLMEVQSVKIKGKKLFGRFKNNEKVTINKYYVLIECRDKDKNAVLDDGAYEQMSAYSAVKVGAGKLSKANYYWKLSGFANGYEYRVAVTRYFLSDGRIVGLQEKDYKWSEWKH